ncbi:4-hydroxy-tetrahydrodipicolinate synthase [Sphingosinicella sp. LY1275]|uniref:4-hydroxy-tetrahydrodipicolinate synthase n=1 Tax=Sphingosinicella sp. LY1275 TaxID=3095379 RepID=UPI002ADED824|nr:4-hydroxy-tetrahydrodipicolinate synthase [Sphingosinicella sp. LY1275]MEA1013472.1 4-hydroxy-tetrahydrodipicolinate synthase [Sphingosinicella sp. LY1275]
MERISGSIPALVTPFRDEAFDEAAFRSFVEWQISEGSHGLVPCGTTGESATMSAAEQQRVISVCVEVANGRVPVIAGCGSNSTAMVKEHMKAAEGAGADAALVVLPYYNRPNQEGIYAHFAALAEASALPIVVYNVPGRTVTDILPETLGRLAALPNIVAIKDASGNLARVSAHRLLCGADFIQLSGNDDMALGFLAMGGAGTISVTANVAPRLFAAFHDAYLSGDRDTALEIQDRLFPLHAALFTDASPGPVKYALNRVRPEMSAELRLPMTPPSPASRKAVDAALEHAGLI